MNTQRPILLVEDNPDDAELTVLALTENGVKNPIVLARNGAEALVRLFGAPGAPPPELPLIVLLDLNLPKLSGIEVLKRIRANERTQLLPVIVLTSSQEECDLVDSYRFGANSYVRKPVDFEAFQRAARQLSLYWLTLNEPHPTSSGKAR
jgi:two-component system, response regulator